MPFFFNQYNNNQNRRQGQQHNQGQAQNPMFASPFSNALFMNNQAPQRQQQQPQRQQQQQQRQQWQQPQQQRQQQQPHQQWQQQQPHQQRQQQQQRQIPQPQQKQLDNRNSNKDNDNNNSYKNLGGFNPNNLPDGIRLMPVNPDAAGDLRQIITDKGNAAPTVSGGQYQRNDNPNENYSNIQHMLPTDNVTQEKPSPQNLGTSKDHAPAHPFNPKVYDMLKRFAQNEKNSETFYSRFSEGVTDTEIKRKLEKYSRQSNEYMNIFTGILSKRNESFIPEEKNIIRNIKLQEGLSVAISEELEALGEFGELYSMIMDYTEKNMLSKILIEKFVRINVMMNYIR